MYKTVITLHSMTVVIILMSSHSTHIATHRRRRLLRPHLLTLSFCMKVARINTSMYMLTTKTRSTNLIIVVYFYSQCVRLALNDLGLLGRGKIINFSSRNICFTLGPLSRLTVVCQQCSPTNSCLLSSMWVAVPIAAVMVGCSS